MLREKNLGLEYLRRSTEKQESSLETQQAWAIKTAAEYGVHLDASQADLNHMRSRRLTRYKAICLDDGVSGADLERPGFRSFLDDALADKRVSHVFIYKRDRFARPDDALPVVERELRLLKAGITVVFSDRVSAPLQSGESLFMRQMELLWAYTQNGEELRKLADRILEAQKRLALDGFRVGGNAPYGCIRVLVDNTGSILEELPPRKTVQQPGCHVRVIPKDPEKMRIWFQILDWKAQGWGSKRIANELNAQGVPSPDAGKTRTDHGIKHLVSGKWNHNTVTALCTNPIMVGVYEYGKRSEGKIRRLGLNGPRPLEEEEYVRPGKGKVVINDPSLRIRKKQGEEHYDPEKWQAIQKQIEERGKSQRGVPRAKDPAKYPLSCRLVDLTENCGSVLYGCIDQGRTVYQCGKYMRHKECYSNQVDAEAMLKFTLMTLRQLVDRMGNRDRLLEKLVERARSALNETETGLRADEVASLKNRQFQLQQEKSAIEYRMAREKDNELFEMLKGQRRSTMLGLEKVEAALKTLEAESATWERKGPERMAQEALSQLDDIASIASNPGARLAINPLCKRLGLWIGLNFGSAVKGKKRLVRRLLSGCITFGNAPLPVPVFGNRNLTDAKSNENTAGEDESNQSKKAAGDTPVAQVEAFSYPSGCQPEGTSATKVNRGERI